MSHNVLYEQLHYNRGRKENNEAKSHHLHSKGKYSLNLSPWQLMTQHCFGRKKKKLALGGKKRKGAQTFSKLRVQAGRRAKLIRPPFSWDDAFSLHNTIKTVGRLIWRLKNTPPRTSQSSSFHWNKHIELKKRRELIQQKYTDQTCRYDNTAFMLHSTQTGNTVSRWIGDLSQSCLVILVNRANERDWFVSSRYLKNPNICHRVMRTLCALINAVFWNSAGILCQEECHICLSRTGFFRCVSRHPHPNIIRLLFHIDQTWITDEFSSSGCGWKQHVLDIPGRLTEFAGRICGGFGE